MVVSAMFRNRTITGFIIWVSFLTIASGNTFAQSSDQTFPTPITTSEIRGQIRARDIGDPRLTTYYYLFNGNRGDVFINVVTTNLNGDIDVFSAEGLNPKTKITIYADTRQSETGRVIYLRRPERLILRIQGRTPNDDPATFQLKFAGSFEPVSAALAQAANEAPKVTSGDRGSVRVNSVGTILEDEPKQEALAEARPPVETPGVPVIENDIPPEVPVRAEKDETVAKSVEESAAMEDPPANVEDVKGKIAGNVAKKEAVQGVKKTKPVVVITDNLKTDQPIKDSDVKPAEGSTDIPVKEVTVDISDKPRSDISAIVTIEIVPGVEEAPESVEPPPNPLAGIFLTVQLKDGNTFERRMSEVISVNVIRGVLTIVTSDGKIAEFGILDVLKMSIE